VPWFGDPANGGETLVTVTNKVQRVNIKICKLIDPGSVTAIGDKSFTFDVDINSVAAGQEYVVSPPYPGPSSCTGLLFNTPVINPDGTPVRITVRENGTVFPSVVSAITVDNVAPVPPGDPGLPNVNLPGRSITFNPGPGVDVVTFTNASPQVIVPCAANC